MLRSNLLPALLVLATLISGTVHAGGIDTDYVVHPGDMIGFQGDTLDVPILFDNGAGGVQGFDFRVCSLAGEVIPLSVVPGARLDQLVVDFFQANIDPGGFDLQIILDPMSWIPLGPGHEIATATYQLIGTDGTLLCHCGPTFPEITAYSTPTIPLYECGSILIAPFDASDHHIIFAGEGYGGVINSTDALKHALEANGQQVMVVNELDAGLFTNPKAIWACLGTWPESHALTTVEGAFLAFAIQTGTPVYVEGGDVWGYDAQTIFEDYDGVLGSAVIDGDDSFTAMTGTTYGPAVFYGMDADYNQDSSGSDYTDRLVASSSDLAGPDAGIVWRNDDVLSPYGTGVMYDTSAAHGNVLVQSWEFGGYDESQTVLAQKYLVALEIFAGGDAFGRGDANADGNINIADALALLDLLFAGSAPLVCDDAGDVNDDGSLNVADVIYLLDFLFSSGAVLPAPGCGVDPTLDTLGCDSSTPCLI